MIRKFNKFRKIKFYTSIMFTAYCAALSQSPKTGLTPTFGFWYWSRTKYKRLFLGGVKNILIWIYETNFNKNLHILG